MAIDLDKQRARWRRAQAKYQKTEKAIAARNRYRNTDAWHITQHLHKITPRVRLANRLYAQEKRSGLRT